MDHTLAMKRSQVGKQVEKKEEDKGEEEGKADRKPIVMKVGTSRIYQGRIVKIFAKVLRYRVGPPLSECL